MQRYNGWKAQLALSSFRSGGNRCGMWMAIASRIPVLWLCCMVLVLKGWARSTHRDLVMSPISTHWFQRAGDHYEDQYMVFPEYKIAILLNHGRRIVWNGWLIHGCMDCEPGSIDDRFSLAIIQTRKTWIMLDRMRQEMQKGKKMPPASKKYTPTAN